jgi:hypothetical protein
MLIIREQQMKAFERAAEARFAETLAGHITETFPAACGALGPAQVRKFVETGIARAAHHGFHMERDIYLYLCLMFMLGSWFDEDVQLNWAARHLAVPSPGRMRKLHEAALKYLDEVAGENNGRLVRALLRIRRCDPARLAAFSPDTFENDTLRLLAGFYPEKFRCQGEAPTRAAIAQSVRSAARYEIQDPAGQALYAGLTFMLGSGFDTDPLCPWAAEILSGGGEGKSEALRRRAMLELERGLKS